MFVARWEGERGVAGIGGPLDHSHVGLTVGSSACTRWFTKPPKTYLEEGKRQKKTTQTTRREGRTTWGIGRVVLEAGRDTHSLLHFSPSEMSLPKSTSTVYGAGFTVPCVGQKRDKCVKAWTIWLARCQSLQAGLAGFGHRTEHMWEAESSDVYARRCDATAMRTRNKSDGDGAKAEQSASLHGFPIWFLHVFLLHMLTLFVFGGVVSNPWTF